MNILTFDIEDWWVYDKTNLGRKEDWLPRLNNYLALLLDLLEEKNTKATFFCLGKVAEKNPEVIKKIADKGHHIGCHSYNHQFWNNVSREEVEIDTRKALDIIENIIGKKVNAYRAPAFSITEKNLWIFEILENNGILYDCSIFPAKRSFGGFESFTSREPSIIFNNDIYIKEFPLSTTTFLGKDYVYSGGGYFRLFPYWMIKSIITKNDYIMTYFHIKDFDYEQIRQFKLFEGKSGFSRYIKNYIGLKNNFSKFKRLLDEYKFMSIEQADANINWLSVSKIEI